MYGKGISRGISKGTYEITQNILPIYWKKQISSTYENLRFLRFKSL